MGASLNLLLCEALTLTARSEVHMLDNLAAALQHIATGTLLALDLIGAFLVDACIANSEGQPTVASAPVRWCGTATRSNHMIDGSARPHQLRQPFARSTEICP